jgi:hypothetical protein
VAQVASQHHDLEVPILHEGPKSRLLIDALHLQTVHSIVVVTERTSAGKVASWSWLAVLLLMWMEETLSWWQRVSGGGVVVVV